MTSAFGTMLQMVAALIGNTISTVLSLLGLSSELWGELARAGGSGPGGFLAAAVVLLVVLLLLGRFLIGSGKLLVALFGLGMIILLILFFA